MHERTNAAGQERGVGPRAVLQLCILALLSLLVSSCAKAHARAVPEAPALDVPAPPPRSVEATEVEAPPTVALPPPAAPQEPARRPPARGRPAPRQDGRPGEPRGDAPKTDASSELPKPADEPQKAPPATTLQTAPTGAEGEVERSIHTTLARATADLNRVDYRALNPDARTQYDTAKRFIQQADEAVRAKNLVFARNLADKAAALAAQLADR